MLEHAQVQLIDPLERFRKEQIGKAKEEKKKFDKETEKICGLLEAHSKINPKRKEQQLQEADTQIDLELHKFRDVSLAYVTKLHEVNEKKKFEFVEIILAFIFGQATFFHNGHDVFSDSKPKLTDLQIKLQRTRDTFDIKKDEAEQLKQKTIRRFNNGELHKAANSREGYLLVHEKKKSTFAQNWLKHYCSYTKENKILTMQQYTQTQGKLVANTDTIVVDSCIRKANELADRRFLFDITTSNERTLTLQSLSDDDRKQWLEVMEGKEPIYQVSYDLAHQNEGITQLSDTGVEFCRKCMEAIEKRGLDDQGLYRIAGVNSKFTKLVQLGVDPKQLEKLDLISDDSTWEIKTITSAMKQYFRNLAVPLLTFRHHQDFLQAIKLDTIEKKISRLQELLQMLPPRHYSILKRLMYHLKKVAAHSDQNLMQASNLGVVLGPTLMRPKEETMAAIMNIKFQSIVIENIIEQYDELFLDSFEPGVDYRKDSPGPCFNDSSSTSSKESVTSSKDPVECPSPKHSGPTTPTSGSTNSPKLGKYKAPGPPPAKPCPPKAKKESEQLNAYPVTGKNNGVVQQLLQSMSNGGLTSSKESLKDTKAAGEEKPVRPAAPDGDSKPTRPAAPEGPLPKPLHGKVNNRYDVAHGSLSSPANSVLPPADPTSDGSKTLTRRTSYQMALDEQVSCGDFRERSHSHTPSKSNKPTPPLPPPVKLKPKGPQVTPRKEWTVRTRYPCEAEREGELSFEAGAIITNVRLSSEQGWLYGTIAGKSGLVPENYTEPVE